MASSIDATKPEHGQSPASSADLRANFLAAKTEIEALQDGVAANSDAITASLYPDVEYTSLNADGNPLEFTSNGVDYVCTYNEAGAAIGKIATVIGGGWAQTFTYDVDGNFESKVSEPAV